MQINSQIHQATSTDMPKGKRPWKKPQLQKADAFKETEKGGKTGSDGKGVSGRS